MAPPESAPSPICTCRVTSRPPLQVLHYVPAGDVHYAMRPLTDSMDERMAPFVKAGRAAFGVVLQGYIGRLRGGELTGLAGAAAQNGASAEYAELTVNRIIDLRRGVDYLATRPDLDHSRIAFLGWSSGAQLGMILAAIETRYRAVVIMGAGLPITYMPFIAHVNPINFASHIRAPKLIVQGRYDENTPLQNRCGAAVQAAARTEAARHLRGRPRADGRSDDEGSEPVA